MNAINRSCNYKNEGSKPRRSPSGMSWENEPCGAGWLAEPFRKPKDDARGKVALTILPLMYSNVGKTENTMASLFGKKSRNKATLEQNEPSTVTWKRSSKQK